MNYVVFCIVILTFVITMGKGIKEWNTNNHSPILTVDAIVASKHTIVTHHSTANAGDTTELHVSGREYEMLMDVDSGRLTFQGTRYLKFEKNGLQKRSNMKDI